jgi:transposase
VDTALLPLEARDYVENLKKDYQELSLDYKTLEEKYQLLLFLRYSRKSEKEIPGQPELFEDPGDMACQEPDEPGTETVPSYTRKKPGRKAISDDIPRKVILHDIPEEEKKCACGCQMVRIGEETCEKLLVIPERIIVEQHIRPKYACKGCEGSGDEDKPAVRIAPVEPSILPHGIVTPELLAFILVNKFCDHLPFYRQSQRFERIGINISRQNMSFWTRKAHEALLPLHERLKNEIRGGPLIKMDETPVQVLGEENRPDTAKSYMWLSLGGQPEHPVAQYQYRETRAAGHIREILGDFSGYLQTDGYEGYNSALKDRPDVIHVGCFAHARRKFHEAAVAAKNKGSADEAMSLIRKLYTIERELRDKSLPAEEFLVQRMTQCEPVLDKMKTWLDRKAGQVPPSGLLGKAVAYTLGQWDKLTRYLESPLLTPDNNLAENAIRPFVLGRKNWLFAGSPEGAEASCGMYSLIETAKLNGLNPYEYLTGIIRKAPYLKKDDDFSSLLPWKVALVGEN